MTFHCPHCDEPFPPPDAERDWHICTDRDPWTQEERDALRVILRKLYPAIQFAPSSESMGYRFGAKMRR